MAEGVRVDVRDALVISALNTPGGGVYDWRNETEAKLLGALFADSPINDPLDAVHRGGVVGTYKRSWVTRRQGNGHRIGFQAENFADHAIYVEYGRSASTKIQVFSWTGWHGDIRAVGFPWHTGTRGRKGTHFLVHTTNRVMAAACGGAYVPLAAV